MATVANPDFLSLVERDRLKPTEASDITSPKVKARLAEKKKAYYNEIISLQLVAPSYPTACTAPPEAECKEALSGSQARFNIPRFRLTESFLHDTVNRNKDPAFPTLLVSHIHDRKANVVILPRDLQSKCQPSITYDVIVRSAVQVEQGGVLAGSGDNYYSGELIFFIENVPALSQNQRYLVTSGDIHRWFISGAITGLEAIQVHQTKITNYERTLAALNASIKNIHAAPIYNEQGRAIVGSPLKNAREAKLNALKEEVGKTATLLAKAKASAEAASARHFTACSITVTEREGEGQKEKDGTTKVSFAVKVDGKKKFFYSDLVKQKKDWNLVEMYATGDRTEARLNTKTSKGKRNDVVIVIAEEDRAQHLVDLGAARIKIMPDGFGVHESYDEGKLRGARSCHRLYHGYFREGQYHEGTLRSDAGVYTGKFQNNSEPSEGTMKYADGTVLAGEFSVLSPKHPSPLGPTYQRGLPHGRANIQFKDGASYEGMMRHGRVSGRGIHRIRSNAP